jgi:hypothetical protein
MRGDDLDNTLERAAH